MQAMVWGLVANTAAYVPNSKVKWAIERNSTLSIAGKSNVNSFRCNIGVHNGKDTITGLNGPSGIIYLSGDLKIDVLSFDCHSALITKDLGKTLKAAQYPLMIIRFISLGSMPLLKKKNEAITGTVEVELAGVVKRFDLKYQFSGVGASYIVLNGRRSFSFTDFNLTPPCKLGCMIKIKDDFDVNFQLILRVL